MDLGLLMLFDDHKVIITKEEGDLQQFSQAQDQIMATEDTHWT